MNKLISTVEHQDHKVINRHTFLWHIGALEQIPSRKTHDFINIRKNTNCWFFIVLWKSGKRCAVSRIFYIDLRECKLDKGTCMRFRNFSHPTHKNMHRKAVHSCWLFFVQFGYNIFAITLCVCGTVKLPCAKGDAYTHYILYLFVSFPASCFVQFLMRTFFFPIFVADFMQNHTLYSYK